jgi:hypothetical protein
MSKTEPIGKNYISRKRKIVSQEPCKWQEIGQHFILARLFTGGVFGIKGIEGIAIQFASPDGFIFAEHLRFSRWLYVSDTRVLFHKKS